MIDLDDLTPAMVILPVVGFVIGWFTASGGFSNMWIDNTNTFSVGIVTKLFAGIGGGITGYVWAWAMS